MAQGIKKSIYIPDDCVKLYNDLVNEEKSSSEMIARAIRTQAIQKYAKVRVSEGAYLAMADGRFDLLQHIKLEDGWSIITMKEEAYRLSDGSRGVLADAKDALSEYLGVKRG